MAHLLPQPPHTSHYEYGPNPWWSHHDHALDNTADSYTYTTAHHVNREPGTGSYQHPSLQYGHFNHQSYVIAQNEGSLHIPLATPDASVSYWQMTQVPTATSGPPLQMGLPAEPIHYPPPYHSQVLSPTGHRNAVTDNDFQAGIPSAPVVGTTYGTTSMMYAERPDATALSAPAPPTAHPTSTQHLPIAHDQGGSGHNRVPQDVVVPSLSYEGSATFQPTNPNSYAQTGLYRDAHLSASAAPTRNYAPPLAMPVTEDQPRRQQQQQQQAYFGTSRSATTPAADTTAQGQYSARGPVVPPAPVPAPSEWKAEAPDPLPRAEFPMAHLPYPEDVAAAATTNTGIADDRRQHSWPGAERQQSPSPASTPAPLSPIASMQTLTFIRYPETEPRSYREAREGRAGGGSGAESDDLAEDDEWSSSSPSSQRRGRRGKKQPKKDPFLACFFCRGRKIACHPKNDGGEDRTCTQCAKRQLPCHYPLTSRRGQRKPQDVADLAAGSSTSPVRATSKARARASSRLSSVTNAA